MSAKVRTFSGHLAPLYYRAWLPWWSSDPSCFHGGAHKDSTTGVKLICNSKKKAVNKTVVALLEIKGHLNKLYSSLNCELWPWVVKPSKKYYGSDCLTNSVILYLRQSNPSICCMFWWAWHVSAIWDIKSYLATNWVLSWNSKREVSFSIETIEQVWIFWTLKCWWYQIS